MKIYYLVTYKYTNLLCLLIICVFFLPDILVRVGISYKTQAVFVQYQLTYVHIYDVCWYNGFAKVSPWEIFKWGEGASLWNAAARAGAGSFEAALSAGDWQPARERKEHFFCRICPTPLASPAADRRIRTVYGRRLHEKLTRLHVHVLTSQFQHSVVNAMRKHCRKIYFKLAAKPIQILLRF